MNFISGFDVYNFSGRIKEMAEEQKKFKTRRINGVKLAGERLKAARVRKKISLEEAENETKIRAKYLIALEENDYTVFTSDIYAMGFLRRYADFLELDSVKLVKEQTKILSSIIKKDKKLSPARVKQNSSFVITPKLFLILLIIGSVTAILGYVGFQVRKFSEPPSLTIYFPQDNSSSKEENVEVKGKADVGAIVLINNEQIVSMAGGDFTKTIKLNVGLNTIQIVAKNRVDKISAKEIRVLYEPENTEVNFNVPATSEPSNTEVSPSPSPSSSGTSSPAASPSSLNLNSPATSTQATITPANNQ